MQPSFALLLFVLLVLSAPLGLFLARARIVAQPDEWLLCIRNGKLVRAGIGICLWRRPGDVVARLTSTLQRVGFAVDSLSNERLRVMIEGFILWSVSPEGDGPFRAFQKLGLVNLDAPPRDLKSPKHLLSTPQHHAFQQLLGASVQRLAATRSLEELLLRQGELVSGLRRELAVLERELGIVVQQIEVSRVRPVDEELLRQMSAEVEERVRERARIVHLETDERAKRRELEADARLAAERAEARREELARENALRLAQLTHDRDVSAREREIAREQALAEEAGAAELARAVLEREELLLMARLDRIRREAEASRDAISAVASAEERKSQAVRDHELSKLVAEKVADALKALPLSEARWVTIGADSPVGSLAALLGAAGELAANRLTPFEPRSKVRAASE